eukprot:gene25561-11211_t
MGQAGIADHHEGPRKCCAGYSFAGGRKATQPIGGWQSVTLRDGSVVGPKMEGVYVYSSRAAAGVSTGLPSTFRLVDEDRRGVPPHKTKAYSPSALILPAQRSMPQSSCPSTEGSPYSQFVVGTRFL